MGLKRYLFDGIPAHEVLSVLQLRRVPRAQWAEVFEGVRLMVAAAIPELNKADE